MFYAVNKETGEHAEYSCFTCNEVSKRFKKDIWYIVGSDSDGWIPWVPMPNAESPVKMKLDSVMQK